MALLGFKQTSQQSPGGQIKGPATRRVCLVCPDSADPPHTNLCSQPHAVLLKGLPADGRGIAAASRSVVGQWLMSSPAPAVTTSTGVAIQVCMYAGGVLVGGQGRAQHSTADVPRHCRASRGGTGPCAHRRLVYGRRTDTAVHYAHSA